MLRGVNANMTDVCNLTSCYIVKMGSSSRDKRDDVNKRPINKQSMKAGAFN